MAIGDVTVFDEAIKDIMGKVHDLDTDTIKVALVTSTATPAQADATPTWGDYSANEVTAAGTYVAGGYTITCTLDEAETSGTTYLESTTYPTWAQDASNGTDARWAIIYNDDDTVGPDAALAFVDLGSIINMQNGDLTITWGSDKVFSIANAV